MPRKKRQTMEERLARMDSIRAAALRLCKASDDGCAEFQKIQAEVPGSTLVEIEDAIDGQDDFVMNVAIRIGNGIYELARKQWSAEYTGDE